MMYLKFIFCQIGQRFVLCGGEENRTLRNLLAREILQPWYMHPHLVSSKPTLEYNKLTVIINIMFATTIDIIVFSLVITISYL